MKFLTDAVSDEFLHSGITQFCYISVDGGANIAQSCAGLGCSLHAGLKAPFGRLDQPQSLLADPSYGEGIRAVAVVSADKGAHVDLHDIAFFQNALRGGDSVNDLVIDTDACASGEAAVTEEGRTGTAGLDMTADAVIELFGGDAFAHHLPC